MVRGVLAFLIVLSYLSIGGGVVWGINICYKRDHPPLGLVTDAIYVAAWPAFVGMRLVREFDACTK